MLCNVLSESAMKKKMSHLSRRFSREVSISHEEMSMTFTYMHCTKCISELLVSVHWLRGSTSML